jgi:hypothetical protein
MLPVLQAPCQAGITVINAAFVALRCSVAGNAVRIRTLAAESNIIAG